MKSPNCARNAKLKVHMICKASFYTDHFSAVYQYQKRVCEMTVGQDYNIQNTKTAFTSEKMLNMKCY